MHTFLAQNATANQGAYSIQKEEEKEEEEGEEKNPTDSSLSSLVQVHNAAQASVSTTPDMTQSHFSDIIDTNLRAPFFLTQAALPHIPSGGRIVLISSISARSPVQAVSVPLYAATKAALEALARDWAFEVRYTGSSSSSSSSSSSFCFVRSAIEVLR
jgi:NAD(P)-dependent dehydrogenase (short-subunit alcohol dehydrogenase family)